jgi:2-methylaconitate cis-trans-isomerase PrpF
MSVPSDRTMRIPCVLMRGGTSRGLVFRREHLPEDPTLRDAIFLASIGSPDVRELDGVGAGDSHTSKVAVVNPSTDPGADLDYLFGEVGITEPRVDYAGNSGNLISALGLYAVEEGIVAAQAPETLVRVRNLNTGKLIELSVPVVDGRPAEDGDFALDGVPGYGPRIDMVLRDPGGSLTGKLLPTGRTVDTLQVPGLGAVRVSLVDASNPAVFVLGSDVGVTPQLDVGALNGNEELLARLQAVRSAASVALGFVSRPEDAWTHSPMVPFLVLVFPPSAYARFGNPSAPVAADAMDVCARVVSLGKVHKTINVTMSSALTAAALVPGTVPHGLVALGSAGAPQGASEMRAHPVGATVERTLRIGHPSGVVQTWGALEQGPEGYRIPFVRLGRTARRIFQGEVLIQPYKLRYLRERMVANAAPRLPIP